MEIETCYLLFPVPWWIPPKQQVEKIWGNNEIKGLRPRRLSVPRESLIVWWEPEKPQFNSLVIRNALLHCSRPFKGPPIYSSITIEGINRPKRRIVKKKLCVFIQSNPPVCPFNSINYFSTSRKKKKEWVWPIKLFFYSLGL